MALTMTLDEIAAWLEAEGWTGLVREEGLIRMVLYGESAPADVVVMLSGDPPLFRIECAYPFTVEEAQRPAIAELTARLNLRLAVGCFEFNWDEGRVAYRTTMPLHDAEVGPETVRFLLDVPTVLADDFAPAFLAVLHGGATPAQAEADLDTA